MVSRRKFFAIFLMMAVLLFLFQFSQVMRESWNYYTNNEYAVDDLPTADLEWTQEAQENRIYGAQPGAFLVGREDSEVGKAAAQWCRYMKYRFAAGDKLSTYEDAGRNKPTMVLIDGENTSCADFLPCLPEYIKNGVTVVFLSLPDVSVVKKNEDLRQLLGIEEIPQEEVTVEGIRLFSGCLMGGEAIYQAQNPKEEEMLQDLPLSMPWYVTGKGSKTYMIGMMDEKKYDREKFPQIIWRNSEHDAMVFAVNGDYMKDETAFGFLNLFLYESSDYALYPVVNAQNTLLIDYPDFSGADEEAVTAMYSRNAQSIQRDIFWPSVYSMITRNNMKPTCFFMTGYRADTFADASEDPDGEQVNFYLRQLNEVGAEAGRSMNFAEDMTLAEKIEKDNAFYQNSGCEYDFRAAYLDQSDGDMRQLWEQSEDMTDISTLTGEPGTDTPLLYYYTNGVTMQEITHEADKYTYRENLRIRSIMTSIGYTNLKIDFHRILWPESKEDSWEVYFDKVYSNISTYWAGVSQYDQTTLSQSDVRVRAFLNLDYMQSRSDNRIFLVAKKGRDDCYFLLRTHGEEIDNIRNGQYRMLEKDMYLIHVTDLTVSITLKQSEDVLQYQDSLGN